MELCNHWCCPDLHVSFVTKVMNVCIVQLLCHNDNDDNSQGWVNWVIFYLLHYLMAVGLF